MSGFTLVTLSFMGWVTLSAWLLFTVELLFARWLQPVFGSTATVWSTCLMFYQFLLFAGYVYAARVSRPAAAGRYRWPHLALVTLPLLTFPFSRQVQDFSPVVAILWALLTTVGPAFLALSMTSVVAQAWLRATRDPRRDDPWVLYGASNAGALLALITYPLVIEPLVGLSTQLIIWYGIYGLFVLTCAACITFVQRDPSDAPVALLIPPPVPRRVLAQWLLFSAASNAVLMAVTHIVTLDAPVPMMWVIPLSLFLVTLILCFGPRPPSKRLVDTLSYGATAAAALALFVLAGGQYHQVGLITLGNLLLFVGCLRCHYALIQARPSEPGHLGTYYVAMSLGGGLGSAIISLGVPLVFRGTASHSPDVIIACGLLILATLLRDAGKLGFAFRRYPVRFVGTGLLGLFFGMAIVGVGGGDGSVASARTFYGIYRVKDRDNLRIFVHGNTIHGYQSLLPGSEREPLAYYHRGSPVGHLLKAMGTNLTDIGVVGLGIGGLSAWAQPGQMWTYYELDPKVEDIARTHFTWLSGMPTPPKVILGDARLTLTARPADLYDLLVIDVFSSDFIPTHLITREAVAMYHTHLKPGGILLFHITNRIFDLAPALDSLADETGAFSALGDGREVSAEEQTRGKSPTLWYAMTWEESQHRAVIQQAGFSDRKNLPRTLAVWTDDKINVLAAVRGRGSL